MFHFFKEAYVFFLLRSGSIPGFYWYEHVYAYRKQEFQNIFDRKLCNCLGQLLLIYYKNVDHGIELDIDKAYGVCKH